EQAHGGLEHAARGSGVFAEQYHALVALHLLRDAGGDRVAIAQLRHALPPSAQTSVIAVSGAGVGEAFAASVAFSSFAIDSDSICASFASETPAATSLAR